MEISDMTHQVNPNDAEIDDLRTIPGIGQKLANRIIEARPFTSPEDMMRVSGINANFLEKIRPALKFEVAEPPPAMEVETPILDPSTEEAETNNLDETGMLSALVPVSEDKEIVLAAMDDEEAPEEPGIKDAKSPSEKKSPPQYLTRSQARWMAFNSGLFAFVLAVALSLGLIASLNGGLRFASASHVSDLSLQLNGLQTQSETLAADASSLRTRMDNLETLGGRVSALEESSNGLKDDLDKLSANVDGFGQQVETLTGDISDLQEASGKYQSFVDGMFELLKTFTTVEGSNE